MKIEAAPNVTLDSINALEANKHYFLSSTTGQIKEASIWMRMKCAIGIGSARTKVNNLVDAVKATLLERAGKSGDAALDAAILEIDPHLQPQGARHQGSRDPLPRRQFRCDAPQGGGDAGQAGGVHRVPVRPPAQHEERA